MPFCQKLEKFGHGISHPIQIIVATVLRRQIRGILPRNGNPQDDGQRLAQLRAVAARRAGVHHLSALRRIGGLVARVGARRTRRIGRGVRRRPGIGIMDGRAYLYTREMICSPASVCSASERAYFDADLCFMPRTGTIFSGGSTFLKILHRFYIRFCIFVFHFVDRFALFL